MAVANTYTFTSIDANHTIAVTFAINAYTINASAGTNGTISPSGAVTAHYGDTPTFTFTPKTGYHVETVTVDSNPVAVADSYTFTSIDANHTIAVTFAINTYAIAATAGVGGTISPSGNVMVIHGENQTFNIAANPANYYLGDVLVDGVSVGAVTSYTFTDVKANHSISATFVQINLWVHNISAAAGPHGSISPTGSVLVNNGSSLSFTIKPDTNHNIKSVLVDGTSVGPVSSYSFTNITGDHSIIATFVATIINILTDKAKVMVPPGQKAPLQVKLSEDPTTNVVVTVAWQEGSSALSIQGTATLNFTPTNWDIYQTVQIAATPDTNDMNATAVFGLSGPGLTEKKITAVKGTKGITIGSILTLLLED